MGLKQRINHSPYVSNGVVANIFLYSKNQYALKLENWGLKKYAKNGLYLYADQKQRKRKLQEGKDTEFAFYGRKRSRSEMDKEIARHVTLTNRLQLWEDIPTPEGVEIFTPGAEDYSASVTVRDVFINNLPLFQLQRAIQALMRKIYQSIQVESLLTRSSTNYKQSDIPIFVRLQHD